MSAAVSKPARVRCAIYTRKSSEEGLEQDFNSLDAQREACAAYVLSQASEGWSAIAQAYDDGGLSGGTLERPALQRLLADIAAGLIDIVVVYKVDRLTRSLLDFAKLVEAFDAAGASFVSVTQSFNTTTSMGRLTLNMLLSFAQFEREVTAERIRDKLAASKAKGMWMGGTPPLGYRPDGRSLAIVEEHADLVRFLYARYLELGSVRKLADELIATGIRVPERRQLSGKVIGGKRFSRGQLYFLLKNPIYSGCIPHKDKVYPGLHPAIIESPQWDQVQAMLASHVQGERSPRTPSKAWLAGKLIGPDDLPMVATHAMTRKVRYRYYVSHALQHGPQDTTSTSDAASDTASGMRIPASEIERFVAQRLGQLLADPMALAHRLGLTLDPAAMGQSIKRCALQAAELDLTPGLAAQLISQVRVSARHVEIALDLATLATSLDLQPDDITVPELILSEPVRITTSGKVLRLVDDQGATPLPRCDEPLVKMIHQARRWWAMLCQGQLNVDELARQEQVNPARLTRILRLAFLSPRLVDAVLAGQLKAGIGRYALIQPGAIAAQWREQEARYLPGGAR